MFQRKTMYVVSFATLYLLASLSSGAILHGLPWGNFNEGVFQSGSITGNPTGGSWHNFVNWSPSARVMPVGFGEDRHLELFQGWYPHAALAYYVDDAGTGATEAWIISCDMKEDFSSDQATAELSLHEGLDAFSTKIFSIAISGTQVSWIAVNESGTFTSASGLTNTYKQVAIRYNALTGEAMGYLGDEICFQVNVWPNNQIKTVAVWNKTSTYCPGTVCVDNLRARSQVLSGIPWGTFDSPYFPSSITGTVTNGGATVGTWSSGAYWSPSAYVTPYGSGNSRCLQLYQSWYPQYAYATYDNVTTTPSNVAWEIAMDVSGSWSRHYRADSIMLLNSSDQAVFKILVKGVIGGNSYIDASHIDWIAGNQNGQVTDLAQFTTSYQKVSFFYNPNTGEAVGKIGQTDIFHVYTQTGLTVKKVRCWTETDSSTYDPGSLYVNSMTANEVDVKPFGTILGGIPWGDCSAPAFSTNTPSGQVKDASGQDIGTWSTYVSWSPSASATVVGTGQDRHIELYHSWYPQGASVRYSSANATPVSQSWQISADLKMTCSGGYATAAFDLYEGSTTNTPILFEVALCGTEAEWKAGDIEGSTVLTNGLSDSVYRTVTFYYDPVSGSAAATLDDQTIFSVMTYCDLQVQTAAIVNMTQSYDPGTLYVDNISANPAQPVLPILHGIPGGNFNSPSFDNNDVYAVFDNRHIVPLSHGSWAENTSSSNATAEIVGTGDSRHMELSQEWYPRYASASYTDCGATPFDAEWKISADLRGSWSRHYRADSICLYSANSPTGNPVFKLEIKGEIGGNGYISNSTVTWVAGNQSGSAINMAELTDTYQTVSVQYNPLTGAAAGKIGSSTIFNITNAGTGLFVKTIEFKNSAASGEYDPGTLHVDNVRVEGFVFADPLPTPTNVLVRNTSATGIEPEVKEAYEFAYSRSAFQFSNNTVLITENPDDLIGAELLANDLQTALGITVSIRSSYLPEASNFVIIGRQRNGHGVYQDDVELLPGVLGPLTREGYRMIVDTDGVIIEGNDERGTIYAVQTLRQLIHSNGTVDCTAIRDWPYMPARGSYSSPITTISQAIEHVKRCSRYKTNMFFMESAWYAGGNWWYNMTGQNYLDAQTFFATCRQYHVEPVPLVQGFGWAYGVVDRNPGCVEGTWILDESHTIYTSSATELNYRHVVTTASAPIVVQNQAKTVTYQKDVDYIIIPGDTFRPYNQSDTSIPKWKIQATTTGNIINGQTVKVSYNYADPTSSTGSHIAYCPSEPETYYIVDEVISNLMTRLKPRIIHLGHDEVFDRKLCSRCRSSGKNFDELAFNDIMHWYNGIRSYNAKAVIMMWHDLVIDGSFGTFEGSLPRDIILFPWKYSQDSSGARSEILGWLEAETNKGFNVIGTPSGYNTTNYSMWLDLIGQYLYPYDLGLGLLYSQWEDDPTHMTRYTISAQQMWTGEN